MNQPIQGAVSGILSLVAVLQTAGAMLLSVI